MQSKIQLLKKKRREKITQYLILTINSSPLIFSSRYLPHTRTLKVSTDLIISNKYLKIILVVMGVIFGLASSKWGLKFHLEACHLECQNSKIIYLLESFSPNSSGIKCIINNLIFCIIKDRRDIILALKDYLIRTRWYHRSKTAFKLLQGNQGFSIIKHSQKWGLNLLCITYLQLRTK